MITRNKILKAIYKQTEFDQKNMYITLPEAFCLLVVFVYPYSWSGDLECNIYNAHSTLYSIVQCVRSVPAQIIRRIGESSVSTYKALRGIYIRGGGLI